LRGIDHHNAWILGHQRQRAGQAVIGRAVIEDDDLDLIGNALRGGHRAGMVFHDGYCRAVKRGDDRELHAGAMRSQ